MNLTAERIVEVTGGVVLRHGNRVFNSYSIDSRKSRRGTLFFAMRGSTTDGHLFILDAARNGASGAVVERDVPFPGVEAITLIHVPDTMLALRQLAASVREASAARFIGITGSAGKTSSKEFTATLLSEKYHVYKSEGNLNSITGMPLSLLAMDDPECGVFEVGMSEPGEIAGLTALLRPHVRVLLNVKPVHLGQFPSIEAIAEEKLSLLKGISPQDWIIFNADDERITNGAAGVTAQKLSYGFSDGSQVKARIVEDRGVKGQSIEIQHEQQTHAFSTSLSGQGNIYNIAAAASVSLVCGLDWTQILNGIGKLKPYAQRGVLISGSGFDVYDDSYNSNPAALEFALQLLSRSSGYRRKVAALGDMLELGPDEAEFHAEAGRSAAKHKVDVLITAGARSRHMAEAARSGGVPDVHEAENSEQAATIAAKFVREGDLVLVKGSRGTKMEKVVQALREK